MKDGDNISHSLQGSTLWQDLHIHIFFPPPPPFPYFHSKLLGCCFFFSWEQDICLPDTALDEEKEINMCAQRHMIHPDATEIWYDVDISMYHDRVCFPRFKHQEIRLGVSGEEYSSGRKTWQRSGMSVCFAYYFAPQRHKCNCYCSGVYVAAG